MLMRGVRLSTHFNHILVVFNHRKEKPEPFRVPVREICAF
jgi:hypothetical protein